MLRDRKRNDDSFLSTVLPGLIETWAVASAHRWKMRRACPRGLSGLKPRSAARIARTGKGKAAGGGWGGRDRERCESVCVCL